MFLKGASALILALMLCSCVDAVQPTATRPQPFRGSWPELAWPQRTRSEAMRAQQAADAGDARFVWQVDAVQVIERYGREELGWKHVHFDDTISKAMLQGPGPLALQIDSCPRTASYSCSESAFPIIERILRKDDTGVWTVRGIRADTGKVEGVEADISLAPRPFLSEFFAARKLGRFADEFLTPTALADYRRPGDQLALYAPPAGSFNGGQIIEIHRIDRHRWRAEARVTVGTRSVVEAFRLGPGAHLDGVPGGLLVQSVELLSA